MIEIENLVKNFGKGDVLKEVNLHINKGERVMIVGGNGSGKTTLLRCIVGSYRYDGDIVVMDKDARKNKSELAKYIGYVPQLPPPMSMTVKQLIEFVCDVTKGDDEPIYEVLKQLKFEDAGIDRSFKRLSGGMQKKVLMAIALGRIPDLLILDEPLAHIDPQSREIISKAVNAMPENITVLYTSHREEKGSIMASRLIEMDNGEIIVDKEYYNA